MSRTDRNDGTKGVNTSTIFCLNLLQGLSVTHKPHKDIFDESLADLKRRAQNNDQLKSQLPSKGEETRMYLALLACNTSGAPDENIVHRRGQTKFQLIVGESNTLKEKAHNTAKSSSPTYGFRNPMRIFADSATPLINLFTTTSFTRTCRKS